MIRGQLRCGHRGQEAEEECSGKEQNVQRPCGTEGWHGLFGREREIQCFGAYTSILPPGTHI